MARTKPDKKWQNEHWKCTRCREYAGALALHIDLFPTWICTDCFQDLNPESILGELI